MTVSTSLPMRRRTARPLESWLYSGRHEQKLRHGLRTRALAPLHRQSTSFESIGVSSTVLHLGLFSVLQRAMGATQTANLVALLAATILGTALNRRWAFDTADTSRAGFHPLRSLVAFGVTWATSALALWLLSYVTARPSTMAQTLTVAVALSTSTGLRFVAVRSWMFGSGPAAAVQA